jgi:hypothetical protein
MAVVLVLQTQLARTKETFLQYRLGMRQCLLHLYYWYNTTVTTTGDIEDSISYSTLSMHMDANQCYIEIKRQ